MIEILHGDNRELLKSIPDNSLDSCVTDPPYSLTSIVKRFGGKNAAPAQHGTDGAYARASRGFMGMTWDTGDVAFSVEFWQEVYRVLKPGAHVAAFGGTRTYHRMACAIEDAGFEIRDSILSWNYGTGFPKSHNISKAIDQMVPATDDDCQGDGQGTSMKPSWEPIVLARKPIDASSVAANVLKYGTGGINIDACRVPFTSDRDKASATPQGRCTTKSGSISGAEPDAGRGLERIEYERPDQPHGRWPPNTILSLEAAALLDEQTGVSKSGQPRDIRGTGGIWNAGNGIPCGPQYGDEGGASRFFPVIDFDPVYDVPFMYCAKPSQSEKNAGCESLATKTPDELTGRSPGSPGEGVCLTVSHDQSGTTGTTPRGNTHPTIKPTALMSWLCRLITPPGGTILEPFAGSGTTAVAAVREGFHCIAMEMTDEYLPIIRARVAHAEATVKAEAEAAAKAEQDTTLSLF